MRRGSSRTVGVCKQCAVYVRGELRCVWCQRRLRAPRTDGGRESCTATIDHYDGDGRAHREDNILPSCRTCNSLRNWPEGWAAWLGGWGQTPARAEARARAQLAAPLDRVAGRALAERWHPGRLAQLRADNARYRERRAGRLPPVTEFLTAEVAA